jgi:hypothetical protein
MANVRMPARGEEAGEALWWDVEGEKRKDQNGEHLTSRLWRGRGNDERPGNHGGERSGSGW